MPYASHNPGCRISYHAKMVDQAIPPRPSVVKDFDMDKNAKYLSGAQRPLVRADVVERALNLHDRPYGENVIIAISIGDKGSNQEDSSVFNRRAIENGKFSRIEKYVYSVSIGNSSHGDLMPVLARPSVPDDDKKYQFINANGLPTIGAYLKEGDCVIGKVYKDNKDNESNHSEFIPPNGGGYVKHVRVVKSSSATIALRVSVIVENMRTPLGGDKFAPRYAQKTTIGFMNYEDMPFSVDTGVVPDIIYNPHAVVTRMTMGLMHEILRGSACAISGKAYDATAFKKLDRESAEEILKNAGFSPDGTHTMCDGMSGEQYEARIFMGPVYMMALNHIAMHKIQMRKFRGPQSEINRQPLRGKSKGGASRLGRMELAALVAHGARELTKERSSTFSDASREAYCSKCGIFAAYEKGGGLVNKREDRYYCLICKDDTSIIRNDAPYVVGYFSRLLHSAGGKVSYEFTKENISDIDDEDDREDEDEEGEGEEGAAGRSETSENNDMSAEDDVSDEDGGGGYWD